MYKFEDIDYTEIKNGLFDEFTDRDIYFSYEWIEFIAQAHNVQPVVVKIMTDNNQLIGYFAGARFRKFGVNIIGSPFNGWNTPYMGLLLKESYNRVNVLLELWKYLKKRYKCMYFEICDRHIPKNDIEQNKLNYMPESTYTLEINKTQEELMSGFTKHCRKFLRAFTNKGATISKVEYTDIFLEKFYETLVNVFKNQNLNPPYSKEKLKTLFEVMPKENMLCLEAYNPDGKTIGMSVSFGFNKYFYAFASGTDRNENYNQKDALRWEAIKYWKSKGAEHYDLMGIRAYKLLFNPDVKEYYRIILTRWKLLLQMRNLAKKIYWKLNKIRFAIKNR